MSVTRKLLPLALLAVLPLSACSSPPSRDDVAERFLIELTDSETMREGLTDFALDVADDALEGNCGSDSYVTGLEANGDENLSYAWRVTCLTYFESDLTAAQVADTKALIAERASGD